jgi:putative nucleotidyltransferase with HDIG domain
MEQVNITRERAFEVLNKYTKSEKLIKHGLTVEAVMRYFAKIYNEDIEKWGIVGLVHDIDYELYPDEHCKKCVEIMKENGFNDEYIHAVQSHGYNICTDVKPVHKMEKVLYTIDELTGMITAIALMKPNRSLDEVDLASIKKKWKQRGFAGGVNRAVVEAGALMLEEDLDYIMVETTRGIKTIANELGL